MSTRPGSRRATGKRLNQGNIALIGELAAPDARQP
jgi:hypothetical protein